ncbi:MAG: hypothetical protein GKR88_09485 [Flavobacteriaceae bacterium]|nr:MAG: hypothetical protein GKR88_09485 [Flavobacteriaceae bacterium]
MRKSIYTIVLTMFFYGCSVAQDKVSSQEKKSYHNEIKSLMQNHLQLYNENESYVKRKIIQNLSYGNRKLEDLFNPDRFLLIRNFKIKSEKDIIHFGGFFGKQDFISMKNQIKSNKFKYWSEFIGEDYFLTKKTNEKQTKIAFSIPVFAKKNNFAIIYIEFPTSGELRILKKINNEWEYIATGLVWRTD